MHWDYINNQNESFQMLIVTHCISTSLKCLTVFSLCIYRIIKTKASLSEIMQDFKYDLEDEEWNIETAYQDGYGWNLHPRHGLFLWAITKDVMCVKCCCNVCRCCWCIVSLQKIIVFRDLKESLLLQVTLFLYFGSF